MCQTTPAKIIKLFNGKALVKDFEGKSKEVLASALSDVKKNDWVLVNADLALQKISDKEANELVKILKSNKQ
ncbi:MAG: HypC/HybG/HupF family hydrogenase formation chaperone [Parcubacteria group bacterium]